MLENLSNLLFKIPNIGKKTAEKIALHLVLQKETLLPLLQEEISFILKNYKICQKCGNIGATDPCEICSTPNRNQKIICLVKDISDLLALEKTNLFNGRYFVLNGLLSARSNITPEKLGLDRLKKEIISKSVEELIFALPLTIDGKTTQHYIINECPNLNYTQLAHGLPIGGNLEYMDPGTIAEAFKKRSFIPS